jgi:hypothetical protein
MEKLMTQTSNVFINYFDTTTGLKHRKAITRPELLDVLGRAKKMIECLIESKTHFGYAENSKLGNWVSLHILPPDPVKYDIDAMSSFIGRLNTEVAVIDKAIESVSAGNKLEGKSFIHSVSTSGSWGVICKATTMKGVMCDSCGHILSASAIANHRSSLTCMRDTHTRDVEDKGWEMVNNPAHLAAIRKSGVEWDVRAEAFKMWAPNWVHQAIVSFNKNEGFGGLSLEEYLKKMKPKE